MNGIVPTVPPPVSGLPSAIHSSPASRAPRARAFWLLAAGVALGFVVLLPTVPRWFPGDPSVLSAALAEGYDSPIAYRTAVGWAIVALVAVVALARAGVLGVADAPPHAMSDEVTAPGLSWHTRALEIVAVSGVVALCYWPRFLAPYGPYSEDTVFLVALHRMHGGFVPFRDFEFLYGPLMLYPALWWTRAFGLSLASYYAYLDVLEVVVFAVLVAITHRYVARRSERIAIWAVIGAQLINSLLGVNYNGMRRLIPVTAILLLAVRVDRRAARVTSAVLLGASLAYGHDQGGAALIAAGGLFALLAWRADGAARMQWLARGASYGALASAVWLALVYALLGRDVGAYLAETRALLARFTLGEAGFRLYWTMNSLAAFALLSLALVIAGRGLARRTAAPLLAGDRFLVAAIVFALVALRSGLTRADVFHLDAGFLALSMAVVLPLPAAALALDTRTRRVAMGLVALITATWLIGNAPSAAYLAESWIRGARAGSAPMVARSTLPSQAPALELERRAPAADRLALAEFLASPPWRGRTVLFYHRLWYVGAMVGVYRRDHLNDDYIYDDRRGLALRDLLAASPEGGERAGALVVIERASYERLYGLRPDTAYEAYEYGLPPSPVKQIAAWTSSVHFRAVYLEERLHDQRWRRDVGQYIRPGYDSVAAFGRMVVLAPHTGAPGSRGRAAAGRPGGSALR